MLLPVVLFACVSAPVTEEFPAEGALPIVSLYEEGKEEAAEEVKGEKGDPPPVPQPEAETSAVGISQELYDNTLADVRHFIEDLNFLIKSKNYDGWKDTLSDDFFRRISSKDFLTAASESNALKVRKIVLKSANDYFMQVVVPSRSNSRVDEIEFTSDNTVKVFYKEERVRRTANNEPITDTRRLRLYELVKTGDSWKIID